MISPKAHDELTDNSSLAYLSGKLYEVVRGKTMEILKRKIKKECMYSVLL